MNINTHKKINQKLCGKPLTIKENFCELELVTTSEMSSDTLGLIHGGFIFGAADYAAMLAVNHPNVVLGSSSVKFLSPVKIGDKVKVNAEVKEIKGKKYLVEVCAFVSEIKVFEGKYLCFVLEKHALKPAQPGLDISKINIIKK